MRAGVNDSPQISSSTCGGFSGFLWRFLIFIFFCMSFQTAFADEKVISARPGEPMLNSLIFIEDSYLKCNAYIDSIRPTSMVIHWGGVFDVKKCIKNITETKLCEINEDAVRNVQAYIMESKRVQFLAFDLIRFKEDYKKYCGKQVIYNKWTDEQLLRICEDRKAYLVFLLFEARNILRIDSTSSKAFGKYYKTASDMSVEFCSSNIASSKDTSIVSLKEYKSAATPDIYKFIALLLGADASRLAKRDIRKEAKQQKEIKDDR